MIKLLKNLKAKEWIMLGLCISLIVLQVWIDLKLPDYMQTIAKLLQVQVSEVSTILIAGGKMLACALGSFACAVLVCYMASQISTTLSKRIRSGLYNKVKTFGTEEMKKFSTSSLITRTTNDITQLQMVYAMSIQMFVKAPIMAVWAIIKITNKGWEWSVATATAVAILIVMLSIII